MAGSSPGTQVYGKQSGLTESQTTSTARHNQSQVQQFEYSVEINMRGDVNLNPTMTVTLSGTQSAFDREYQIYSIVHRFSTEFGYTMEIAGQAEGGSGGGGGTPDLPGEGLGIIGGGVPNTTPYDNIPERQGFGGGNTTTTPQTNQPFNPFQVGPNPGGITP